MRGPARLGHESFITVLKAFAEDLKRELADSGHKIRKKIAVTLNIVLAIKKYFALPFTLSFGNPNIFWIPVPQFGLPFGTWQHSYFTPYDYPLTVI